VPPIIEARSDLTRGGRVVLAREADQPHRQPAGQVEEVQFLDVPGDPAKLVGESFQQRIAEAGVGVQQLSKDHAWQHQRLGRLQRGRGGRSRGPVQQCQLAEEVARSQRGDDGLFPLGRGQDDLGRAGRDDV
jgi:hypothetical protein